MCIPAILFPLSSKAGPYMPIPNLLGTVAIIPPPTPDFAGTPTCTANSPDASYIPQVTIIVLNYLEISLEIKTSSFQGATPSFAITAENIAKSLAVASIEHCLK